MKCKNCKKDMVKVGLAKEDAFAGVLKVYYVCDDCGVYEVRSYKGNKGNSPLKEVLGF